MSTHENIPEILPPKVDSVFKAIFGNEKNKEYLIALLEAVLDEKIEEAELLDTAFKQMKREDKLSVLDIKAKLANGKIVDIEMQINNTREMRNRISFYNASMIREQMDKGDNYLFIKPVISIIIMAESLIFESNKCHNVFLMSEKDEHFVFNDLQQIHILDLSRIDREKNKSLSDWLRFINAEKEEEFMKAARQNKTINSAFRDLKVISADERERQIYHARMKRQWDIQTREYVSKLEGEQIGMQKGMQKGMQEERQKILTLIRQGFSMTELEKHLGH